MDNANVKDRDGNEWQPIVNEYQQRQLRCVAGPRLGDVVHDERLDGGVGISTADPVRPVLDSWTAAIRSSSSWE